jgi:hypothetical protein
VSSGYLGRRGSSDYRNRRALVVECWIRDNTKVNGRLKYPGQIRRIVVANNGKVVLADDPNPSINPLLYNDPKYQDAVEKTYLYWRYPYSMGGSIYDPTSTWPYSEVEQTLELLYQISDIITKLNRYVKLCLWPPLLIPTGAGVHRNQLSNDNIAIIRPSPHTAGLIRFLQPPSLPSDFMNVLNWMLNMFDRIYAIENVDRGQAPSSWSGKAMEAMLSRNQVLLMGKSKTMDRMVRRRGNSFIGLCQNFSWSNSRKDFLEVAGKRVPYHASMLINHTFDTLVESGPSMTMTKGMQDARTLEMYGMGLIDNQAALEKIDPTLAKEILQRGGGQGAVQSALATLEQAGIEGELMQMIVQALGLYQGGQGSPMTVQQPRPFTQMVGGA